MHEFMEKIKNHSYDVVIIGGGGAGLASALFLSDALPNVRIGVLCKTYIMGSHTTSAKGGINAALGNVQQDDVAWHIYDTVQSGKGLCDIKPTEYMCRNAPYVIDYLTKIGVKFDVMPNGEINQRIYGGQTVNFGKSLANRACFVGDFTGHAIMSALTSEICKRNNIVVHNYMQVLDFDIKSNSIIAYCMDQGTLQTFRSRYTIFATGGFSQIYQTNSSSHLCTGCGHRVLFQNGITLKDIELVQFHPTGLSNNGMLISEACRSEGGILVNSRGERFMGKYSPMMEMASRDIVAKAICTEAKNGKTYLDLRHVDEEIIKTKLLSSYTAAKHFAKTDITKELLHIYPTAHYNMGGVTVDENYRISEGIYAIGELACASVHGANRLGCNSLLELFTSAKVSAHDISQKFKPYKDGGITGEVKDKIEYITQKNSDTTYDEIITIQKQIKQIMNNSASIVKTQVSLQNALSDIEQINAELQNLNNFSGIKYDSAYITLYETQSLALMAKCVLMGSLFRKYSIGSHFREDFPQQITNPQHTCIDSKFDIRYTNPF